jgi:hypothetical protein
MMIWDEGFVDGRPHVTSALFKSQSGCDTAEILCLFAAICKFIGLIVLTEHETLQNFSLTSLILQVRLELVDRSRS